MYTIIIELAPVGLEPFHTYYQFHTTAPTSSLVTAREIFCVYHFILDFFFQPVSF